MQANQRVCFRSSVFPALRALVLGWLALLVLAYLIELLLVRSAALLGPWLAPVRVLLDCGVLGCAGWVAGRSGSLWAVILFAGTLAVHDLDPLLPLNAPWLLRLIVDSLHDARYLESLLTTAAGQALLFGCFFAGARLSGSRSSMVKISLR